MFYTLTVSALYAAVYAVFPAAADALLLPFIALLLIPAVWVEARHLRRRD